MFGWSKAEKHRKEIERLLHELFGMSRQDAAELANNHAEALTPQVGPLVSALALVVIGVEIAADTGETAHAARLKKKLLEVTPALIATRQLSQREVDVVLARLAPVDGAAADAPSSTPEAPSRVASARAGAIFTLYWQIYLPQRHVLPEPTVAEMASLEGPLFAVFRNPDFNLRDVVSAYQRGKGSNDVLQKGMKGHPDHVFRWFRIGQVVSGLLDAAQHADDSEFELAKVAVRGNLTAGGASANDCDLILQQAMELRRLGITPGDKAGLITAVSRYQELYMAAASRQDAYEDFERRAIKHGGVFVSYSHADGALVKELAGRLEDAAISHWLDEKEVLAGAGVRSTLAQALAENCIFLLVLSRASLSSTWVQYELELANQGAARGSHVILPVLAGGLKADEVPELLRDVIAVDLSDGLGTAFPALQRAITAHLVTFEQRRSQAAMT